MKGQLIPFMFILLLVGGVLMGYVFYNIFYGTKYQFKTFYIHTVDAVRNLIESLKNYLHLSLTYSSHQAMKEHAASGGMMPAGSWICNGPTPPSVDDSKECLEKYTKYYLNVYFDLFNTSLPVNLREVGFSGCVYGVDEEGVLSGKYDEGNFWVNCSDASIAVFGENINEYEKINMDDFITRNRYWYMFRIFYEWALADVYSPCICACTVGCAGCDCTRACAEMAYEDLQRRFDENVICKKPVGWECCDHEFGPISCTPQQRCLPWDETYCQCIGHFCTEPPNTKSSPETKFSKGFYEEEENNISPDISPGTRAPETVSCNCDYWVENRLAATYLFVCEDHKYYIPSKDGPVPLVFKAFATARWRAPDACHSTALCQCPQGTDTCESCTCPPCPENECW